MVAANDAPTSSPRSKLAAKAARTAAKRAAHSPSTEDGDAMPVLVCRHTARHKPVAPELAQSHFFFSEVRRLVPDSARHLWPARGIPVGAAHEDTALEEGSHGARNRPTGAATAGAARGGEAGGPRAAERPVRMQDLPPLVRFAER